jgi:hypothetical protein
MYDKHGEEGGEAHKFLRQSDFDTKPLGDFLCSDEATRLRCGVQWEKAFVISQAISSNSRLDSGSRSRTLCLRFLLELLPCAHDKW